MTSRVETVPHGVEPQPSRQTADWLGLGNKASATRRRQGPIPGSELSQYICNSDNLSMEKWVVGKVVGNWDWWKDVENDGNLTECARSTVMLDGEISM